MPRGRHQAEMAKLADLYLKPPVHEYSTLEFKKFQDIYQVGYTYARPLVQEFAKQLKIGHLDVSNDLIPKNPPSPAGGSGLMPKPHRFE